MNNKVIFSTKEFDNWVDREGLLAEEKKLIIDYLDKDKSTLEAGTASGRILFEIAKLGFTNLSGFDYISEYVETAKMKNKNFKINFSVQDATSLDYSSGSFNQIIYLQQIISTIEVSDLRLKALREAYRVLEKDGTALFSFLSFESKQNDRLFKLVYPSIKFFRFLKRKKTNCQYIPWLKFSGKINFKAIFDIGPYNYWYRKDEVFSLLKEIGFNIVYYGYPIDIAKGSKLNIREISGVNSNMGHLYVVCKKI